jgi:hypothetical protein
MPTGTHTPPTSDLIERFNAIMADVLACVTDAALKAAGVPWPLRLLLAPLLRRRIARWSAEFSSLVADGQTGRRVDPKIGPVGDLAMEPPCIAQGAAKTSATTRVRSASGRQERATGQLPAANDCHIGVPFERRAARPVHRGAIAREGTRVGRDGVVGPRHATCAKAMPRDGTNRWRPQKTFRTAPRNFARLNRCVIATI